MTAFSVLPQLPAPFMTPSEVEFLAAHLTPRDSVWEWGSGESSLWLARHCRRVTSVEHQRRYAASLVTMAPPNLSAIYAAPDLPYAEGTDDDGDYATFRRYVECYTGRDVDVVIIDGRARVACARWVAECSMFGPGPKMRIFLHDCDREQYAPIWKDDEATGWRAYFREVGREGRLMLLEPRPDEALTGIADNLLAIQESQTR